MDFIDAATAALVSLLQATINAHPSIADNAVPVSAAWPDFRTDPPTAVAYVVVSTANPTLGPVQPRKQTFADGVATYAIAKWSATLQVDVFARYKDTAAALSAVVRSALSDPPSDPGRTFACAAYHNAKVRIIPEEGDREWGADAALGAIFRRTLELSWIGTVYATKEWPTFETLVLDLNSRTTTISLE